MWASEAWRFAQEAGSPECGSTLFILIQTSRKKKGHMSAMLLNAAGAWKDISVQNEVSYCESVCVFAKSDWFLWKKGGGENPLSVALSGLLKNTLQIYGK